MIGDTIVRKAVELQDQGVPMKRAVVKAEGTVIGFIAATLGMLLLTAPAGMAGLIVWRGGELTVVVGVILGGIAFGGFMLFAVGMTMISRDASPQIAKMGELLVKLVRAVRGGKNGT